MKRLRFLFILAPLLAIVFPAAAEEPKSLFDGKTLAGWEGSEKWWRVEDGCIVGGSLTEHVPRNEFLASLEEYDHFVLRLKFKLTGDKGFINSGVQIRSQRVPNDSEMIGYQCDIGDPTWWGCIYDESRRNRVLAQSDMEALNKVLKRGDWNEYEIRAEGPRVITKINGVVGVDYTEEDETIPQKGRLGIQVHGGGAAEIRVKDITIEKLPAPKQPAPFQGAPEPPKPAKPSPLTPEEQQATFSLPPGFEIELVAAEQLGIGKFIAVDWDHAGRLWTMTALEYPVDANENRARAEALFAKGGRDKVLVFDNPYGPGPHEPRVWAEGLAMPLGLMPYKNGAYVQYGPDIRFYKDTDGDGKADGYDVVLTGFGIEDSHLFPHQFTRGPGGWIYLAQGAFNHGDVRRPDGTPFKTGGLFSNGADKVRFSYCKLARLTPDGSDFQLVSSGPNNIWGLVVTREGEMFIQEANDIGYPVVEFTPGTHVPGIGDDKLKPYAPVAPPTLTPPQMGGTGLSGLALSESRDGWPFPYGKAPGENHDGQPDADAPETHVIFLANPITSRIQAVKATLDPATLRYRYRKLPDFCLSSDPWFRPVAIAFGPDNCLYVTDWYNQIISHNEVPRDHPDRDKTRGRVWRIRHTGQPRTAPPDLTKAAPAELVSLLASPNAVVSRLAAEEIRDRALPEATPALRQTVLDETLPASARIAAVDLLKRSPALDGAAFRALLRSPNRLIRAAATDAAVWSEEPETRGEFRRLAADPDPRVRETLIRGLTERMKSSGPSANDLTTILLCVSGDPADYGAKFLAYLARGACELWPEATGALLASKAGAEIPVESRMPAALSLPPAVAAKQVAALITRLDREPNEEELLRLADGLELPEVAAALRQLVERPAALEALLRVKNRFNPARLSAILTDAARGFLTKGAAERDLAARLAGAFKLTALEDSMLALLQTGGDAEKKAALRALRDMGGTKPEAFLPFITAGHPLRAEALAALTASTPERAVELLLKLLPGLTGPERRAALDAVGSGKAGAAAVTAAFNNKQLPAEWLEGALADKLQSVLGPEDAGLLRLLNEHAALFRPVLLLDGDDRSVAETEIVLDGPFTVESWVRFAPGISNADSLLGGRDGGVDFNFYDGKFRVYGGGDAGDVIIATKPVEPEVWTHVAATRDAEGRLRLYLNGELDTAESRVFTRKTGPLRIGGSNAPGGTAAAFTEFRVWNRARTPEEIRAAFDRTFADGERPEGLTHLFTGSEWGRLKGGARIARTTDFPKLMSETEARALERALAKYRAAAEKPGNAEAGKTVFAVCLTCHSVGGAGGNLGPALDGSANRPVEHVLRAILTPDAAVEGGYRLFRAKTKDGAVTEGFLVRRDDEATVIRQVGGAEIRLEAADIEEAGHTSRSIMSLMYPAAFEALPEESVADLFAYLRTLK